MRKLFKNSITIILVLVMIQSIIPTINATEKSIYISVSGSDSADGTIEAPLKTIEAAVKVINSRGLTDVIVYFREGLYSYTEGQTIKDCHAGITFKAYNNEKVILSTSERISDFSEETINGVRCFVKRFDTTPAYKSIYSISRELTLTRYPEEGYLSVKNIDESYSSYTDDNMPWELTKGQKCIEYAKNAIPSCIKNEKNVIVRILHYWHDEMIYADHFDYAGNKLILSKGSSMMIRKNDRFFLENVFEALNSSGEYYVDYDGKAIYYVPFEGEQSDSLTLYGTSCSRLLTIENSSDISFENIQFSYTAFSPVTDHNGRTWIDDMDFPQACIDVDCAITTNYCRNLNFTNCDFSHIGCSALYIGKGSSLCSVDSCYFEDIGANAVFVDGMNCQSDDPVLTHDITINNNEIYRYGRRYFGAIGILMTFCERGAITHNEIHDGYYTAISVGWSWGYNYHVTKEINIDYNLIYDIGQGWLSDMGGIYTLGLQPGTTIRYNVIHNVAADTNEGGYGGWGIYFDEGSSGISAENNLVFCCGSQGFHTHYGDSNMVKNCISVLNGEGAVRPGARYMGYNATNYYGNIFMSDGDTPVYSNIGKANTFTEDNNILWNYSKGDYIFVALEANSKCRTYSQAKLYRYIGQNDVIAAPGFTDPENFDFTFSTDETINKIGFTPWDYSVSGTIKDSVVGVSHTGGLTPYNRNAKRIDLVDTKLGLFVSLQKLLNHFRGILNNFNSSFGFTC